MRTEAELKAHILTFPEELPAELGHASTIKAGDRVYHPFNRWGHATRQMENPEAHGFRPMRRFKEDTPTLIVWWVKWDDQEDETPGPGLFKVLAH